MTAPDAPKRCRGPDCVRAPVVRYGWKHHDGALLKADFCAECARKLRARVGVVCLRNYRTLETPDA